MIWLLIVASVTSGRQAYVSDIRVERYVSREACEAAVSKEHRSDRDKAVCYRVGEPTDHP